ncbi:MAG: hypothetical protein DRJ40_04960 [Thermoprotei archaeon]|nr:MAG: hypothetical protein DRJ40_04565 [Thermoprotei archaeon]RLE56749.1 MAG: hypothetical protein DRJ40_04960 [Thermoprotei archaeon]
MSTRSDEYVKLDDLMDYVFSALGSSQRRKILEVIADGGCVSPGELLRRCGIRDSSTLNYHLSRMRMLIDRDPHSGGYRLTPLGRLALEMFRSFRSVLATTIPYLRGVEPIIVIKPRCLPYLVIVLTLLALVLTTLLTVFNIFLLMLFTVGLLYAGYRLVTSYCTRYVVSRYFVLVMRDFTMFRCRRVLWGNIVGFSLSNNPLASALNLTFLNLLITSGGNFVNLPVGYVERSSDVITEIRMLVGFSHVLNVYLPH